MSFLEQTNKGLIWGLLQDSGYFNGLSNNKFPFIQQKFEDILKHVDNQYASSELLEKNKLAIEMAMKMINKENTTEEKKIQVIYKSQDIQEDRKLKINNEYNDQKANMDALMNPIKPEEIDFNDKKNNSEDKPIGQEMDRLIAERMASRERELDIPQVSEQAKQWVNNNNNTEKNEIKEVKNESKELKEVKEEKKVTFKDHSNNNIFDRLKKKTIKTEVKEEIDLKKEYNFLLNKKKEMLLLFKDIENSLEKILEHNM